MVDIFPLQFLLATCAGWMNRAAKGHHLARRVLLRLRGYIEYDHILSHTRAVSTTERVTVTLSAELVEEIDRLERNRSRFIAEAIEHELARRRREALLSSVRSPHPETADLADTGLGDWTSDLPDDEGLVDVAGGTAVRWVEGHGWVRESA